jgi:hypothetical protein
MAVINVNNFKLSFNNEHTVYENYITAQVKENELLKDQIKSESVVENAVKELKKSVDKNASSKMMLEHMMNFIHKINGVK